jgi:ribosomal protein S2
MKKNSLQFYFSMTQLLRQGVHLGTQLVLLHSTALKYILTTQYLDLTVINLTYTLYNLKNSLNLVLAIASKRKQVLIINASLLLGAFLKTFFSNLKHPISTSFWIPGRLTNFRKVAKQSKKAFYLHRQIISSYIQVERVGNINMRVRNLLNQVFNPSKYARSVSRYIARLLTMPSLCFITDSILSKTAVHETSLLQLPGVVVNDASAPVSNMSYPIPGNTVSISALLLYYSVLKAALVQGIYKQRFKFIWRAIQQKFRYLKYVGSQIRSKREEDEFHQEELENFTEGAWRRILFSKSRKKLRVFPPTILFKNQFLDSWQIKDKVFAVRTLNVQKFYQKFQTFFKYYYPVTKLSRKTNPVVAFYNNLFSIKCNNSVLSSYENLISHYSLIFKYLNYYPFSTKYSQFFQKTDLNSTYSVNFINQLSFNTVADNLFALFIKGRELKYKTNKNIAYFYVKYLAVENEKMSVISFKDLDLFKSRITQFWKLLGDMRSNNSFFLCKINNIHMKSRYIARITFLFIQSIFKLLTLEVRSKWGMFNIFFHFKQLVALKLQTLKFSLYSAVYLRQLKIKLRKLSKRNNLVSKVKHYSKSNNLNIRNKFPKIRRKLIKNIRTIKNILNPWNIPNNCLFTKFAVYRKDYFLVFDRKYVGFRKKNNNIKISKLMKRWKFEYKLD